MDVKRISRPQTSLLLRQDKTGLAYLLKAYYRFTGRAFQDERRQNVLRDLLCHWGDTAFAAVLSEQTLEIRKNILARLVPAPWLKSQIVRFKSYFPLTYHAGLESVAFDPQYLLGFYDPPRLSDRAMIRMIVDQSEGIGPVDAKMFLRALRGDKDALAYLLKAYYKFTGGAAPDEFHENVLRDLLCHWGDTGFAAVLSEQTLEIRRNMLRHLVPTPWLKFEVVRFKRHFPLTYHAGLETVD